ncbi:MAG: DCC1-like thiol-disulfide oxidoreductase family protein, partial [Bacteroidota bacterium]
MKVVIFDSHCNLCSHSVYFVVRREKQPLLKFASNRSDFSVQLFKEQHVNHDQVNTLAFWDDD